MRIGPSKLQNAIKKARFIKKWIFGSDTVPGTGCRAWNIAFFFGSPLGFRFPGQLAMT